MSLITSAPLGHFPTTNTLVAASFAALNVRIGRDHQVFHDRSQAHDKITWHIGMASEKRPDMPYIEIDVTAVLEAWNLGKTGNKLEAKMPHHPFLTGYRGELNFGRIREACKGVSMNLVRCPGHTGYVLTPAPSPRWNMQRLAMVEIDDIDIACALATMGSHLVKIGGTEGAHLFYFTAMTAPLSLAPGEEARSIDVRPILQQWFAGTFEDLNPWHPFTRVMCARFCHRCLLGNNKYHRRVIITDPKRLGKFISAEIPENASDALLKSMQKRTGGCF